MVLIVFTAAACSTDQNSSPTNGSTASMPTPPSVAPPSSASPDPTERDTAAGPPTPGSSSGTTPVRVTVGSQSFTAKLYDNPTAYDLAEQLPLTLTMKDLNGLEKTGRLPRALTTEGVPRGSDPEPDEIGYYAPGQDLVLYYGDVGFYNGIIRIGRFDTSIDRVADQPDGAFVTVERG